jgi:anti-anti-sigma factor
MTHFEPRAAAAGASAADPTGRPVPLGATAAIAVTADPDGSATAAVTGELDLACAHELATALCSAVDTHAAGVMLDLAEVGFFDCSALHALERAHRHAESRGRRIVLRRSSAAVDRVLELARVHGTIQLGRLPAPGR